MAAFRHQTRSPVARRPLPLRSAAIEPPTNSGGVRHSAKISGLAPWRPPPPPRGDLANKDTGPRFWTLVSQRAIFFGVGTNVPRQLRDRLPTTGHGCCHHLRPVRAWRVGIAPRMPPRLGSSLSTMRTSRNDTRSTTNRSPPQCMVQAFPVHFGLDEPSGGQTSIPLRPRPGLIFAIRDRGPD